MTGMFFIMFTLFLFIICIVILWLILVNKKELNTIPEKPDTKNAVKRDEENRFVRDDENKEGLHEPTMSSPLKKSSIVNDIFSKFSVFEREQILRHAALGLAKERTDYRSVVKLLKEALKIVKGSKKGEFFTAKRGKLESCYRLLTIYSLKIPDLQLALRYSKLYGHPGYLGDAYFEIGDYKNCLDSYTKLGMPWSRTDREVPGDKKISSKRMPKVIKSFFGLNYKHSDEYDTERLRKCYPWLFDQVLERFLDLDSAFKYYHCNQPSTKREIFEDTPKNNNTFSEKELEDWLAYYISEQYFEKVILDKKNAIGRLINDRKYQEASKEMISLYETHQKNLVPVKQQSWVGFNLVEDISDIHLLMGKTKEAIKWVFENLETHWRMVDYYLNLKFLVDEELIGDDIIKLGHSSQFRNNIALFHFPHFYEPSLFALRHEREISEICCSLFNDIRNNYGKKYLKYIYEKYVDEKTPLRGDGEPKSLYRHCHLLFGGKFAGQYNLENEVVLPNIPNVIRYHDGNWIHVSFSSCEELVQLISKLNFEAENKCRLKNGISERGKGWASENEIYAMVKDLFRGCEVVQHYSPNWLSPKHLDIYIPALKFGIEYQGKQHFEPVEFFGGEEGFERGQVRDRIKAELCNKNKVKILYIRYDDEDPENTISDFVGLKELGVRAGT